MCGISGRIVLVLLVATAVVLGATSDAGGRGAVEKPKLSMHDRELLSARLANGEQSTTILVAAQRGSNGSVIAAIERQGGAVRYREDSIDYTRFLVPTEKVEQIAATPGIEAVALDEVVPWPDPATEATSAVDPPSETTPGENPYLPTRDIGAPQFVAAHPTYDGRGVTIGFIDSGIDLLTPELQTAKALDGTPVRKIRDWVTLDDFSWLGMNTDVRAKDGTFTVDATSYAAPTKAGAFSFATFAEIDLVRGSQYRGDLNRDGDTGDVFAVLWDRGESVWVDTNQNASFADERELREYSKRFDIGTFGTDDPATPTIRESVPFVVQIDHKDKAVNIGIAMSNHGTHVAGIAAGKDYFGAPDNRNDANFDGAAPEAQIVCVRADSGSGLVEGMIYLAKAKVDVISLSTWLVTAYNRNRIVSRFYDRLIEGYGVQIFVSAGNDGPGIKTIFDPSEAADVMSVGASVHADTLLSMLGNVAAKTDGIFPFSSRGPNWDGGFKPQVVAPGFALSTIPGWQRSLWGAHLALQGTSMSAPMAAGGAALLISGAKQAGRIPFGPAELRQAINSGARYLPAYGAYEQGNGLMNVGRAWSILTQGVKPVEITSSAPATNVFQRSGPGIYERDGWRPGDHGTRSITLTRLTSGQDTYNLSWIGNDGTFGSLPPSVTLRHNAPVSIPISISTATAGAHSALLHVDNPATPGIDYEVMNTVIAALDLVAMSELKVTQSGSVDRPDKASFFFRVPSGMSRLRFTVHGAGGTGSPYPGRVRMETSNGWVRTGFVTGGPLSETLPPPDTRFGFGRFGLSSGVWEVVVEASRISTEETATYFVTGEWDGVLVSPTSVTFDPATIGAPHSETFTFTNLFGPFTGKAQGTALGSAFSARPTIADGTEQSYDVMVPAGSTRISARIGNASDTAADLVLFLLDCTADPCFPKAAGGGFGGEGAVSWPNPATGLWRVVVQSFSGPSGSTDYDYVDVVENPAYGSVVTDDPVAFHPDGDVWSTTATATVASAPPPGHFLKGFVQAQIGGSVLAEAEIVLKNVGP